MLTGLVVVSLDKADSMPWLTAVLVHGRGLVVLLINLIAWLSHR